MPSVRLLILCLTLFVASCNQASPDSDAVPAYQTSEPAGGGSPILSSDLALPEIDAQTSVRTESFPRPPYSGATYFIYERNGQIICTKLKVCNKYDECHATYIQGRQKDQEDVETGDPYSTTAPVIINPDKLKKHVCLAKFKLIAD